MIVLSLLQNPALQGTLAVLVATYLPGWALARIPGLRGYGVVAAMALSPAVVYLLVTISALLHVPPASWGVPLSLVLLIAFVCSAFHDAIRGERRYLTLGQIVFCIIGIGLLLTGPASVWHDQPAIFESDALVSWNPWAKMWAKGLIPDWSYGYPQLVPVMWSVPYWFMGPEGQYFSRIIFLASLTLPFFVGLLIAKKQPLFACLGMAAYAAPSAFVAEPSWFSGTLSAGLPDWIACSFASSGLLLALAAPDETHRTSSRNAILAHVLFLVAASIKLVTGLFAIALVLLVIARGIFGKASKKELFLHAAMLAACIAAYLTLLLFVTNPTLPPIQAPAELTDYFTRAYGRFSESLRYPAVLLAISLAGTVAGLRSLPGAAFSIATIIGTAIWIRTTAYDLRAELPFLTAGLILAAFFVQQRAPKFPRLSEETGLPRPADSMLAAAAFLMCLFIAPTVKSSQELAATLGRDQLSHIGKGYEFNTWFRDMLDRGCYTLTSYGQIWHIESFSKYNTRMRFYHANTPGLLAAIAEKSRSEQCLVLVFGEPRAEPYGDGLEQALSSLVSANGIELESVSGWRRIVIGSAERS